MNTMGKESFKIFLLLPLLVLISACNGIGEADFGSVADEFGTDDDTTQNEVSFSGIDTIDQITDSTARINWTNNADATFYQVINVTSGTSVIAFVDAPATSYDLSGLSSNRTYKFKVRALDTEGLPDSNTREVSFTTNLAPSAPSALALSDPASSPASDSTPTILVSGVKNGDTIKLFSDSTCSTQLGSASASSSTVEITSSALAAGDYSFYANSTNADGNSSACSTATAAYSYVLCPANYSFVPANASLGVDAFCVMKYEAKNVGSVATSQASGNPWVSISQTAAKAACTALGANYDLISNPEWMTIAINVEAVDSNWSNGTIGDGALARGWTTVNTAVAPSTDANCLYDTTSANTCAATGDVLYRRTLTLSNGEEVWDFSGNVWEWVDWTLGGALSSGPTSCTGAWTEFPDVSCGALASGDYMPENPAGIAAATYNASYGLGRLYGGTGGAARRGGNWSDGSRAGAFTLSLHSASSYTYTNIGFRCVYRP